MRYLKYFFVMMILMCLFYGCDKQESVEDEEQVSSNETLPEPESEARIYSPSEIEGDSWLVELSPPDKTLFELATKIYSDSELEEIVQFEGTVAELNEQYPVECVKKYVNDSGDLWYLVSYLGNSSIVAINFDDNGNRWDLDEVVYHPLQSKAVFDDLVIGRDTMEDVQKIDPQGDYLLTSGGMFCLSAHCTTDGYLLRILYEWDNHEYIKYLITEIEMVQL